jgi:hypothetical protein
VSEPLEPAGLDPDGLPGRQAAVTEQGRRGLRVVQRRVDPDPLVEERGADLSREGVDPLVRLPRVQVEEEELEQLGDRVGGKYDRVVATASSASAPGSIRRMSSEQALALPVPSPVCTVIPNSAKVPLS